MASVFKNKLVTWSNSVTRGNSLPSSSSDTEDDPFGEEMLNNFEPRGGSGKYETVEEKTSSSEDEDEEEEEEGGEKGGKESVGENNNEDKNKKDKTAVMKTKTIIPNPKACLLWNPKEIFLSWTKGLKKPCAAKESGTEHDHNKAKAPTSNLTSNLLRQFEGAKEVLKNKVKGVSETARAWSATTGVPSMMGGHQHQRLEGGTGDDLLSPSSPHASYQSSPTLIERGRDKSANLFGGGNEAGYQRLNDQSSARKNSWGEGWGLNWAAGGDEAPPKDGEEKGASAPPPAAEGPPARQGSSRKSNKASSKDSTKSEGKDLLLDLDSPLASSKDSKQTTSGTEGHTWDNWDDDGWEKVE